MVKFTKTAKYSIIIGMANTDILIAEDDAVLREVYMKKFTISGYTIRTAQNGEEAIAEIQKKEPDILILDINMPILDGFGVLERYPKTGRKFPVIMLTNFGDDKNKARGLELGADDYFIKSEMTIRKLLEMVETLLKAKQYWGEKQEGAA
jgi:DNA-binding response OmpR family regulator